MEGRHKASQLVSLPLPVRLVLERDLEHRPDCGSALKIIAEFLERPVIEKILTHKGLELQPPPKAPVREPEPHHPG